MKKIGLSLISLALFSNPSLALTSYHCEVAQNNQLKKTFDFIVDIEPNRFIELDSETAVGCLRFDSTLALLSCTISSKGQQYVTVTDLGVSQLSLSEVGGDKLSLSCKSEKVREVTN